MPELVNKTSAMGYKDYKYILYGNNISGLLSIAINPKKIGKVKSYQDKMMMKSLPKFYDALKIYLCDVPAIPNKMKSSFHESLMTSNLDLFISSHRSLLGYTYLRYT